MILFKDIFNFDYSAQQVKISLESAIFSAFSASIVVPILLFYITSDILNYTLLSIWVSIQFAIFMFRLMIIQKLKYFLSIKSNKILLYFRLFIGLIFLSAILNLYIIVLSISSTTDILSIFLLAVIIITLSAGSISTLLGVFNVYVLYVILNMFTYIVALLYFGGEEFYLFTFILSIFTLFTLKTGQKQHQLVKNISSLNDTFQTIYNTSSDAIILIKDLRFKDCNETAVKLFKFHSKQELLNTHISEFMPRFQDEKTLSLKKMLTMLHRANTEGHHSFEWQFKKQNGDLFWVEFSLVKITIEGEKLLHGMFRDITKRKEVEKDKEKFQDLLKQRVEEEVEKNRKKDKAMMHQSRLAQMGEMINMIAHQWRQPLSAISATSALLNVKASRDKLDAQTTIELANKITEFSLHLSETIDDFRSFFKPNKVKLHTDYLKITKSVRTIIDSSLQKNNIKLEINIVNIYEFYSYENELKQVLLNFIKNAEDILVEKAIKEPLITIKIDKYDLVVCDNGEGVDDSIIEKIFEPYFSTKLKKDGTGLGLYMSKLIIEEHCDGDISVCNTQKGASFKITLGEGNARE